MMVSLSRQWFRLSSRFRCLDSGSVWTQQVRDVQVEPRLQVIGPSMYGRVPKIAIGQSEIRQSTEVKDLSSLTTHLQFYGFLMNIHFKVFVCNLQNDLHKLGNKYLMKDYSMYFLINLLLLPFFHPSVEPANIPAVLLHMDVALCR